MKVTKKNIVRLMDEQHISQAELSRRSGVKKTTLNRYLQGHDIPVTKAKAIAHALGVTLAELSGDKITLSSEEHEIVECFRIMPIPFKNLLLMSAHIYAELGKK